MVTSGRTGLSYTNVLTHDALLAAAEAAAAASDSVTTTGSTTTSVNLRARSASAVQRTSHPSFSVAPAEKIELLRQIDDAARAHDGAVKNVAIDHVAVEQQVWVATTDGTMTTDERVRTRVTCRATAVRDGRTGAGFCGPGVGAGMELYELHPPELIGVQAGDRAVVALEGRRSPSGAMPVILGPSGGGLLVHEACGHGLESDGFSRGTSAYSTRFGQQVGSSLITVMDDPTLPLAYGSYGCDDEGRNAGATTLIDRGVLVGTLTDRDAATTLSGGANGRRESFAHGPLPRMSNTYIVARQSDPSAIIASVDNGVYVATIKGGDVDIITGDFSFTASEAYLIESGEVTVPLAGLTLLGNGATALGSAAAVGNDLAFAQALCGKDGQWVPVSYGSPTLLIEGLAIAGGGRA